MSTRRILVTGADGFIGRNLIVGLRERGFEIVPVTRQTSDLAAALAGADAVVHLAGANRPSDPADFMAINRDFSQRLGDAIIASGRPLPLIVASTQKALDDTEYGRSKLAGEQTLAKAGATAGAQVHVFRLPNVFGKWSRPNYNSAIATFCHNIPRGLPIEIHDPATPLKLVYIDDVVQAFATLLANPAAAGGVHNVAPVYQTTVGAVADMIRDFHADRSDNRIADVGTGLTRALYATYVSFLPPDEFSYPIVSHRDLRGAFSEMLKTSSAGQFSYFNALPGVTRGGHYHHSKVEKFLIVHGRARFRFRHILTDERHELETSADEPVVVETIPGWTHDVTNVGDDVMVSLLWANEVFDRTRPDTIGAPV
ncbi:NAD-dependent epimerase/dehydratase family protein [Sphingomonas crusticola]|uniref:polysaccharide biosynthesis C-terminal domain-containing protein n=1 Tax=Sphingomonas crusticola TaxID=1697973 RepID=UPI000E26FFD5|nr:NAD-dependent epimerase/dehydratase family protein [Sphingomonas crusticola]